MSPRSIVLFALVSMGNFTSTAFSSEPDGIVRNKSGAVALVSYFDLLTTCPPGTHIPSIREWAEFAQQHGAKGIIELDKVKEGEISTDYLIEATNIDNREDSFYFIPDGYVPPQGDLGKHYFWSSSFYKLDGGNRQWGRAYFFINLSRFAPTHIRALPHADIVGNPVRCVADGNSVRRTENFR